MAGTNILNLDDPQTYECLVKEYLGGHSNLTIYVRKKVSHRHVLCVNFWGVEYFSGHMKWHGADFYLDSIQECISILESSRFSQEQLEKISVVQSLKLYSVVTQEENVVNIIAGGFTVKNEEKNLIQQEP